VNSAEVVMNGIQSNRMAKVVHLLAETVCQSSEPAHRHPHSQIGALNVAGRNVPSRRTARNDCRLGSNTNRRAIAPFFFWRYAVQLHKSRVVNVAPECVLDCVEINPKTISRKLNAICQPTDQVLHELMGTSGVPRSNQVRDRELGISINRRPSPHVAITELAFLVGRDVLLFGVAKLPDFITLNSARLYTAHSGCETQRTPFPTLPRE